MKGKKYLANRLSGRAKITVFQGGDRWPLRHVMRHSPDGFEWSYGGSGPSDAALSIMVDHFKDTEKANELYQEFKWRFIATAPENGFEITTEEIDDWLEAR